MIKKIGTDLPAQKTEATIEYVDQKTSPGMRLSRNLALTGLLLLAVTSVRNAELPSGKTVLTAVQEVIDSDWDSDLGKISFVSNLFPETVSVFFESTPDIALAAPCFGDLAHRWTEAEPYLGYLTTDGKVYAMSEGQVMSLAHGINEEKILRVRQADGIESFYYNLSEVFVQEGDQVTENTCLGQIIPEAQAVIDIRKNGLSIDPTNFILSRDEDAL